MVINAGKKGLFSKKTACISQIQQKIRERRSGRISVTLEKPDTQSDPGIIESELIGAIDTSLNESFENHLGFVATLMDTIPNPIYYKDSSSVYTGCNDAFAKMIIGSPKEHILGKKLFDFPYAIPFEMASVYHKFDLELLLHGGTQTYEGVVRKADGTTGTFIFNKAAFTESNGSIAGIVGVMVEITDYKNAVHSLLEKTTLLESLLGSLPDMVFFKDLRGTYQGCNPIFSEYVGAPTKDIIGRNDYDLFDEDTATFFREKDRTVLESGSSHKNEEWVSYPDGTKVLLETFKAPLKMPDGKLIGSLGISRDITARKNAEQLMLEAKIMAEIANRSKNEFISNMSHELRTPLNSIIGFSDVLLEKMFGELNDEQMRYVSHIHEGGKQLLHVINSIIDISKIETGEVEIYYETVDLIDLIHGAIDILKPLADQKNIVITVNDNSGTRKCEMGRNQISQVLYNIIGNAIKFTPVDGSINVSVKDDKDVFVISVIDTGIGIPAERINDIFLPFKQLESHASRRFGGTGLGLALVKEFIEMHGGNITVESEPEKGSTFTFTIPKGINGNSAE